jgi:hypothetical protein
VFPVRYKHHIYIYVYKVKLSPQQTVEVRRCISCEERTSSTYKKVKLSP